MRTAIRVERLSKLYTRYAARRRFATLKSALLGGSIRRDLRPEHRIPALEEVTFTVPAGATVAVIGPNGSGKSTLLKLLAGILRPTSGVVDVAGRVAALLELGAGFHPEVSGRENVIINGIMLGLSRREIERRLPDIVRFAELEEFIDDPVKTYSSGMYVRLGFSVAVAVEPDVLLVDEVLAVGDEAFSHKCLDRFRDLKRRGRTVLLVTHALTLAESLADEAILIEDGRLTGQGLPRAVIDRYRGHVEAKEGRQAAVESAARADPAPAPTEAVTAGGSEAAAASGEELPDSWRPRRWGNRLVELRQAVLRGTDGALRSLVHTGDDVALEIELDVHQPQTDFNLGVAFFTRDGHLAYGTNTEIDGFRPRRLSGPAQVRLELPGLALLDGSYSVDVAVCRLDGAPYDYWHGALTFAVRAAVRDVGVARLAHRWRFAGDIELTPAEP